MALPIRPSGSPSSPTQKNENNTQLPQLDFSSLSPRVPSLPPQQQLPSPPIQQDKPHKTVPDGYAVDKETGKLYKQLPGFKKGVLNSKTTIRTAAKGGFGLSELRTMVEEADDFDIDNWGKTADIYLAHLRVPPDKQEIERLRKERLKRQQEFDKLASSQADDEGE